MIWRAEEESWLRGRGVWSGEGQEREGKRERWVRSWGQVSCGRSASLSNSSSAISCTTCFSSLVRLWVLPTMSPNDPSSSSDHTLSLSLSLSQIHTKITEAVESDNVCMYVMYANTLPLFLKKEQQLHLLNTRMTSACLSHTIHPTLSIKNSKYNSYYLNFNTISKYYSVAIRL